MALAAAPRDWRALAPKLSAAILAALAVTELAHISLGLTHLAPALPAAPSGDIRPVIRQLPGLRLASAHLFGMPPTAAEQAAVIARSRAINWVLTGVIAEGDPAQGVAIVGEAGRIEVLKAGDSIRSMPGSRLTQIFNDHVVIDRGGLTQSVELPRQSRGIPGASLPLSMGVPREEPDPNAQPPLRQARSSGGAESLLAALNPEPRPDGSGRFSGMTLHPTVLMQRQYGMREGDLLTQINGQPLNEPDAIANALKGAGAGETVSVTFTHAGVEQTITMPVVN